jgi:hypothetical protein
VNSSHVSSSSSSFSSLLSQLFCAHQRQAKLAWHKVLTSTSQRSAQAARFIAKSLELFCSVCTLWETAKNPGFGLDRHKPITVVLVRSSAVIEMGVWSRPGQDRPPSTVCTARVLRTVVYLENGATLRNPSTAVLGCANGMCVLILGDSTATIQRKTGTAYHDKHAFGWTHVKRMDRQYENDALKQDPVSKRKLR